MNKRSQCVDMMVAIHLINFELAEYFVAEFDDTEVARRLVMYEGLLQSEGVCG